MKNKSTVILLAITFLFVIMTVTFLIGRCIGGGDVIIAYDSAVEPTQAPGTVYVTNGKLNINTADIEALCELPGIGQTTAQRIIAYREQHGEFKDIIDLMKVNGIGEKTFDAISELITVGG